MRRLFPYIAVLLLYAFTPGLCELAEIASHFVETGDVHTSDQERHREHGNTKGEQENCHSFICHSCICHTYLAVVSPLPTTATCVSCTAQETVFAGDDPVIEGVVHGLFRPPIA